MRRTRSVKQRMHGCTGDYPSDWKRIADRIKTLANWRCERCGHPHETPTNRQPCDEQCQHPADGKQRMLTVHHLDLDKTNCAAFNLAALCQKCHLEIQGRVDFEQYYMFEHSDWMIPHVIGRKENR